ncbi:MAG: Gfo/Idh/MocA family oxidoreductase [Arenimonas sp.]|nr:Gfo/Idh/MocA family oxidoreductase [Rhizobium sp.]MBW8446183.1 Gfo/Idh/MocA family oxidoreductase [Arenimonas sp.]
MPDQLTPLLLVGTGAMSGAYAKVLKALGQPFVAAGRGAERAQAFAREWGVEAGHGPLPEQIARFDTVPETAIVAVSAVNLAEATAQLIKAGVRRLLVEKPVALNQADAENLDVLARNAGAEVHVAYNRRFYASVEAALKIIEADGGVLSVKFDFTEARTRIEALDKDRAELAGWLYGNSTHVIDLAFFLGGHPKTLFAQSRGGLAWHPSGAIFTGCGTTDTGADFSYHANWLAPGRWGVEVMTAKSRLVLQPMEQLFRQDQQSFAVEAVAIDEALDKEFKPGLYRQTEVFLSGKPDSRLMSLSQQAKAFTDYTVIRDGNSSNFEGENRS